MAPSEAAAPAPNVEALWRKACEATPYVGIVELETDKATGQEQLIIRCEEVAAEYAADARVLDDGRTVGFGVGDRVTFGIVMPSGKRAVPIAVNVWRAPKKKRQAADPDAALWEGFGGTGDGFDYSTSTTKKKKKREEEPAKDALLHFEQSGVIRNQSRNSGNYFIQCAGAWERWARDVTIRYDDMPEGIDVGDAVYFWVEAPRHVDAAPIARDVRKAEGEDAEGIKQAARQARKGAKGGGKGGAGAAGKGAPVPSGGGAVRRADGPIITMSGIVKKKSAITGRHFVFCQDISDVCGQDAQIPQEEIPDGVDLKCGDRISFDIEEPDERRLACPLAFNIRVLGGRAGARRGSQALIPAAGDGEEDADGEDVEIEEEPDDEAPAEELQVSAQEVEDADAAGRLEAEGDADVGVDDEFAEGEEEEAAAEEQNEEDEDMGDDPDTVEGWAAAQKRLFGDLPKLPGGWIRLRSKSKGLVYYYNTDTGESSPTEPKTASKGGSGKAVASKGAAPAQRAKLPEPTSVPEWVAAQKVLFGDMPKLPPRWIRMRSKSKGLIYYYNLDSGESTPHEPQW